MTPEEIDATWDNLRREALTCPVLHRVVALTQIDKERAMIAGLIWFSRRYREAQDREVERLMNQPNQRFAP